VPRSLILAGMAVLAFPGVALAQASAAAGGWTGPFAVVAAGVGMAIAAGLCGLGQGRAIASAVEAMGRQPAAAARIQTAMIIGLALIESLAIYTLIIAIILLFAKGINFSS
jgi:F-type H+-transporting ATPase subunit c